MTKTKEEIDLQDASDCKSDEKEIPKRYTPVGETLRELFLKSGNLCAYPGCAALNMNSDGVFTAEVCHIEAAEPGGERFNEFMNNESRRHVSNLMIMCHTHHVITNDIAIYTVAKMKEIKASHEGRFSDPERAILEQLKDWTALASVTMPVNLGEYAKMVNGLTPEQVEGSLGELRQFIQRFRYIPMKDRKFLSVVVSRMNDVKNTKATYKPYGYPQAIILSDLLSALNLSQEKVIESVTALKIYNLGYLDECEEEGLDLRVQISPISSGWYWSELYDFCKFAKIDLEVLTIEMDFARLDASSQ